jgi:hypothetical protein
MSASAISLTRASERVPRWSSSSHASARPDRCSALLSTPHSSPRAIVMAPQAASPFIAASAAETSLRATADRSRAMSAASASARAASAAG